MSSVMHLSHVSMERDGLPVLRDVTWSVDSSQRWVVLGSNGSGKTSLLELIAAWEKPSSGTALVLGDDVGLADTDWLRPRVGLASAGMAKRIPRTETVEQSVMSAAIAAAVARGDMFDETDFRRTRRVLSEWRLEDLADRPFGSLSEGEMKRAQIARSIMTDPELLLMDEPVASLDLGSREEVMKMLGAFASNPGSPAIVMVTHHVEEIPPGFTHTTFGITVDVGHENSRYWARARTE
ncbi:MAG: ATP-binding cassette domain-containing protein [Microbacteriaceae bacterium]|nr:ATP-binding cassette domain-containing protein [Microbacteriaceae bacterium]